MTVDSTFTIFPMVDHLGAAQVREGKFTGPNPYATGGDPVDLANDLKGLSEVWVFLATNPRSSAGTAIRLVAYDRATDKLQWYDLAGAEIANGTDLSDFSGYFFATGK